MRALEPNLKAGEMGQPINIFVAGAAGGLLSCLALVPSDVIKCNMQVRFQPDIRS
jgi:hypothetical protein